MNTHYQTYIFNFPSFTCRCGAFPGDNKDELKALVIQYQNGLEDLVDSGRYETRDDFTVVNQPFLSETKIPVNVSIDIKLNKDTRVINWFAILMFRLCKSLSKLCTFEELFVNKYQLP